MKSIQENHEQNQYAGNGMKHHCRLFAWIFVSIIAIICPNSQSQVNHKSVTQTYLVVDLSGGSKATITRTDSQMNHPMLTMTNAAQQSYGCERFLLANSLWDLQKGNLAETRMKFNMK